MHIKKTVSPPVGWENDVVFAGEESGLLQSVYWSRVIGRLDDAVTWYVSVEDGGSPVRGGFSIQQNMDRLSKQKHSLFPNLTCLDGPFAASSPSVEALKAMLVEVKRLALHSRCRSIRIAPPPRSALALDQECVEAFRKEGFAPSKWATYIVDLRPDEDALFMSVKHAVRKCVKKCQRAKVTLRKMETFEELRDVYWDALNQAHKHFGLPESPCLQEPWDEDTDNLYHYYCAVDAEGKVLACLGMYIFNGVATEVASAITPLAYESKIPAQDYLHWEMMVEAKRMGAAQFDLAGVSPAPSSPKEEGIRRFKEKWGGQYVEYYRYTKSVQPWALFANVEHRMKSAFSRLVG